MKNLGLKDFLLNSRKNKRKLKYFLQNLRWELRYAWRRAWFGYDDVDMFECFEMFRRRMIRILEDFINYGNGLLPIPNQSEHYNYLLKKFPEGNFDEKHTKIIYQTMIYHLYMMDEDYVIKTLNENNYSENHIENDSCKDYKKIYSIMLQNKDAFMKLFSLFYYSLWD